MSIKTYLAMILCIVFYLFPASDSQKSLQISNIGNTSISINGTPGRLLVYGSEAKVLASDSSGNITAASSAVGSGRVVVVAHPDFLLPQKIISSDNDSTLFSWLRWLIDQKKVERIGITGLNNLNELLAGYDSITHYSAKLPEDLSQFTLLIIGLHEEFSSSDQQRLIDFVEQGGSMLCSAMGWVWRQYSADGKKRIPISGFKANRFLEKYGIKAVDGYANSTIYPQTDQRYHLNTKTERIMSIIKSRDSVSVNDVNRLTDFINSKLAELTYPNLLLKSTDLQLLADLFKQRLNNQMPSEKFPVKNSQSYHILLINMINMLMKNADWETIYPIFGEMESEFPGYNSEKPVESLHKLQVIRQNSGRYSTGLYALPGEVIKVEIPESWLERGVNLRIGAHSDYLGKFNSYRSDLKRWPEISYLKPLNQTTNTFHSSHGGIIYLEYPKPSAVIDTLPLIISGRLAVLSDSLSKEISIAPWGELSSQHITITASSAKLKQVGDRKKLLEFWDKAVLAAAEFAGVDSLTQKEMLVPDIQISSGYMHSGHPVVCHMDAVDRMLNLDNRLFTEGSWGLFHELGHNFQQAAYTFDGGGEVTVNFFTLYIMAKVLNLQPQKTSWLLKNELKSYFSQPVSLHRWKENPKTALFTFIPLINSFGWENIKSVCRDLEKQAKQKGSLSDLEKRDGWVRLYSEKCGYSLTHYFAAWGFEFSAELYRELSYLPEWKYSVDSIVLEYAK